MVGHLGSGAGRSAPIEIQNPLRNPELDPRLSPRQRPASRAQYAQTASTAERIAAAQRAEPILRPTPGPRPALRSEPFLADAHADTIVLDDNERRYSALSFAVIILLVTAVGILGSVFQRNTDTVVGGPATEVLGAVEIAPTVVPTTAPTTTAAPTTTTTVAPTTTTSTTTTTTTTIPLSERSLSRVDNVFGNIAPKSVTATGTGLFFAQNMMYRHSVTVYNDEGSLLQTIDDRVDLAAFGIEGGVVARGAPVEAAPTSDGSQVYVSNYAMYGPGFGPEPDDGCNNTGWDNSFLYRVDASGLEIDQVIEVGAVPKFLAVSPDDRLVVVANWCSFDVSIVDTALGREVSRIDIGRHPRGIAITSDSSTAYVTEQGGSRIAVIDLDAIREPASGLGAASDTIDWGAGLEVEWIEDVGRAPRSVVLSPDDRFLYATLNGDGEVVKIDVASNTVIASVRTGDAPRSMAISEDGEALYVVNYNSDTLSKVLTESMEEVQELNVADKPIGITVDPETSDVWVSAYSGVLEIYEDQ